MLHAGLAVLLPLAAGGEVVVLVDQKICQAPQSHQVPHGNVKAVIGKAGKRIPPERAWERIASASTFGDCLITVSSHVEDLSEHEADKLGLVM